jgi:hypothetical protein
MPKFIVPVTRDVTETALVEVVAENRETAVAEALAVVTMAETYIPEWERDDCTNLEREVYFAGGDDYSAVEEVEDGPVATLRFRPEAWQNDYAVTVDAEGEDTWEIPCSELRALFPTEEDFHEDHNERDALHYDHRAPKWIREWSGPYEVELMAGDVWEND